MSLIAFYAGLEMFEADLRQHVHSENDLLFPVIESVHVLAICLVVGSILVVDLRLLSIASVNRPVSASRTAFCR